MRHRPAWLVLVAVLLAAACTPDTVDPDPERTEATDPASGAEEGSEPPAEAADEPTEPEPEPCRHDRLEEEPTIVLIDQRPVDLALEFAQRTHRCADDVVVAPADDAWSAAIAAAAAVHLDAPLLLFDASMSEDLSDRVAALDTARLLAIGVTEERLPDRLTAEVTALTGDGDRIALARQVADRLELPTLLAVPEDDLRARAAALARLDGQVGLLPLPADNTPLSEVANGLAPTVRLRVFSSDEGEADRIADRLLAVGLDAVVASSPLFRNGTSTTWLVDPDDEVVTALTASAARGRGEALLPIDATDLRQGREDTTRLRRTNADRVVLTGQEVTADVDYQLELILNGPELPGGGFTLFEDRRMVALYGSPETEVLGAMGEQPLDETIPRLREVAEPYGADGREILPAFEMIVTIASAAAEPTGDYSRRTPIEVIRPWVDRAAEEDIYVILDLQPGRTDFLTQAKEYEELLLEPHVGLALDPEWRLEPHQVHLQQIGSVDAEEVQEVADWLAELTRENNLPEKLLILHQFRFSMLPDREEIEAPPELAVVVHMDGQGPQGAKDETYDALTAGVEDRWLWGWKNFYDEDDPVAEPQRVLDLDPLPVFVSYQ